MRQSIQQYGVVFAIFLALDIVWLSNASRWFYLPEIGTLLRERPQFLVAFLFYALFALGLLVFVVQPALAVPGLGRALMAGGFFGLVAYATYDLTNLASLKGFTTRIALIDMAWGTVLSGSVAAASVFVIRALKLG